MDNEIIMDNEIPVKYITDYKILPSGEKEIIMHLIPGMEVENDNLDVDKYLKVANSDIEKILQESKAIPDDQTPPKDNLQEYEFNIFRILQNLDNVLQFIETDEDFKQSNNDFNKEELLLEIKRMEKILQKVVVVNTIKDQNTTAERAGEIGKRTNPVNSGNQWVNSGNSGTNSEMTKGGNKK